MYYNKEEQLRMESVPVVIRGMRDENSLVPNPKTKHAKKVEMQQYYGKRRFILASLSPREEQIFSMYYGLDDGNFKTLVEISKEFALTSERVRQILLKTHRKLVHPTRFRPCKYLIDDEIGYDDSTRERFCDIKEVDKLCDEKIKRIKMARIKLIPKEQKLAADVLNRILSEDITKELDEDSIERLNKISNGYNRYGYILNINIDTLKNNDLQFLVEMIHSMGLIFKCEAEYEEDWETACRLGIMRVGIDKIMKKFGNESQQINVSNEVKMNRDLNTFESLMKTTIEELNLSVRSYNCLKRARIDTVEELLQREKAELISIRNMGLKSFNEIIDKLHSMDLEIRPDDIGPKEWLLILKEKFNIEISNAKKINMDINEIPEKYRKTYAIGAGVVASQEIKNTNRLFTRIISSNNLSNVLADKPSPLKVKISKQPTIQDEIEEIDKLLEENKNSNNLLVEAIKVEKKNLEHENNVKAELSVIRYIEEDILSIYDLQTDYIVENEDVLIEFILNNQSVKPNEKIKLIKFVRNAKKNNYVL